MDVSKFFIDYKIPYSTDHKNIRDGWVGIQDCPFCNSRGKFHLGYNTYEHYFSCWMCGGHSEAYVISKLIGVNYNVAEEIVEKYGGGLKSQPDPRIRVGMSKFKFPSGIKPFDSRYWTYLHNRGFDPDEISKTWDLQATGPHAMLDGLDYSHRILAPFSWDRRIVTFQARDITEKHRAKYMACPPEREIISHKHILYGKQEEWRDLGICVEGITDVWKLGTDAFATLGVKYTRYQVRAMIKHFKEIVVLYDPEEQAQIQAQKLVDELIFRGVKAWKVDLDCDPGDLSQDDAQYLLNSIITKT
jgi:hypothetical protein